MAIARNKSEKIDWRKYSVCQSENKHQILIIIIASGDLHGVEVRNLFISLGRAATEAFAAGPCSHFNLKRHPLASYFSRSKACSHFLFSSATIACWHQLAKIKWKKESSAKISFKRFAATQSDLKNTGFVTAAEWHTGFVTVNDV